MCINLEVFLFGYICFTDGLYESLDKKWGKGDSWEGRVVEYISYSHKRLIVRGDIHRWGVVNS